jgi:hypothetical protein
MTTLPLTNSISPATAGRCGLPRKEQVPHTEVTWIIRGFLLIALALTYFALSQTVQAAGKGKGPPVFPSPTPMPTATPAPTPTPTPTPIPGPDGDLGNGNTAEGTGALFSLTTGVNNTAMGFDALYNNNGDYNTANGYQALYTNTTGTNNTATGLNALYNNTGDANTATGVLALFNNTTGYGNTAIGNASLFRNATGNRNIALGVGASQNLTTGDNNIDIGNFNSTSVSSTDVAGEANTIRIGHPAVQTATFIAGIRNVIALTGTLPVVIDANGQLGVGQNIINPNVSNSVSPSRSNEEMTAMKATVAELKSLVAKQAALITRQQKGMEVLTARVKEQASQIQKVSDKVELNKPAPRTVENNQ